MRLARRCGTAKLHRVSCDVRLPLPRSSQRVAHSGAGAASSEPARRPPGTSRARRMRRVCRRADDSPDRSHLALPHRRQGGRRATARAGASMTKLFVGNLSSEVTAVELRAAFAAYGQVTSADTDSSNGDPRGFGVVERVAAGARDCSASGAGWHGSERSADEGQLGPFAARRSESMGCAARLGGRGRRTLSPVAGHSSGLILSGLRRLQETLVGPAAGGWSARRAPRGHRRGLPAPFIFIVLAQSRSLPRTRSSRSSRSQLV